MAEIKFEKKLKRLEEIVSILESGEKDLDESLSLYEEGLKLSKELNNQLNSYDELINKITEDNKDE